MTGENRWAFLAKEPTVTKVQDLIAILRYVVALRHESDGHPMNDPAVLQQNARRAAKVSWTASRVKFLSLDQQESSSRDHERKVLVDYWVKTINQAINEVLSCQTDRDSAIWLERRMGDEDKTEQLERWQVSDKKIAPTLKRIDAAILERYQAIHLKNKSS